MFGLLLLEGWYGDFREALCENSRCMWLSAQYCVCQDGCHQQFCLILTTERVTASGVSCRLEEITGFFARNNEEYLALIFEKEGSYLGREVSCLQGSCISWIDIGRESPVSSRAGLILRTSYPSTGLPPAGGSREV